LRDNIAIGDAEETSFTDASVQPSTSYRYQVEAIDQSGNGSLSDPVMVSTPARADIASPGQNQEVPTFFPVSGTYQDLRAGEEIWVLINPDGEGYFPQNGPAAAPLGGKWNNQKVSLGGPVGVKAVILAVIAKTPALQQQFRAFVAACSAGACPAALSELPGPAVCESSTAVSVLKSRL
jgi:hypothetical protein